MIFYYYLTYLYFHSYFWYKINMPKILFINACIKWLNYREKIINNKISFSLRCFFQLRGTQFWYQLLSFWGQSIFFIFVCWYSMLALKKGHQYFGLFLLSTTWRASHDSSTFAVPIHRKPPSWILDNFTWNRDRFCCQSASWLFYH